MGVETSELGNIKDTDLDPNSEIETDDHTEEEEEGADELCDINAVLAGFNSTFEWSVKLPVKDLKTKKVVMKNQKFILKVPNGKDYQKIRAECKAKKVKYSNKFILKVVKAPKLTMDKIKLLPETVKVLIMNAIAERCGYTDKANEMADDFL